MASPPTKRAMLALRACDLFPPSIQDTLISDSTFQSTFELTADARITFGEDIVSFQSSKLFNCIRSLPSAANAKATLLDEAGDEWVFDVVEIDSVHRIAISHGEHRFVLPDFYGLSPDQTERVVGFEREAEGVNLPNDSTKDWRQTLTSRSLLDGEVDLLLQEIEQTPLRVMTLIGSALETGQANISTLVPRSERYYERLVGRYQQHRNITDYAPTQATELIRQLLSWRPLDGFLLSLLLSSHSSISSAIKAEQPDEHVLVSAYEWLEAKGDRISQIGAIEIGLQILDNLPAIEPSVKAMIEAIRDDDPDKDQSRVHLSSSLIMLVDGELSRTKILRAMPPFWRRMASIAQASLIERCIINARVDVSHFNEWASQVRAQQFYLQTLIDLRQEPRWLPDYVSPSQLKAEFVGRIVTASRQNTDKIRDPELRELLLGEGPQSLPSMIEFPFAYLTGPLEGGLEAQLEPPPQLLTAIEEQLSSEVLTTPSLAALVNSALIFRLDSHHAQLAAKALRSAKHQIRQVDNEESLFNALRGVAIVAAVTRSGELAEELRILVRRCRREPGRRFSIGEATVIGLIAAAAYPQLREWSQFVGEWLTELAFDSSQPDEMKRLLAEVRRLCQIAPELWFTCGRAEAALSASVRVTST